MTVEAGLEMAIHGEHPPGQLVRRIERLDVARQDAVGAAQLTQRIVQRARIAGGESCA